MWGIIAAVLTAIVVGGITTAVVLNWDEIREEVKDWLHEQGLNNTLLMDAWVEISQFADAVVKKVKVRTATTGEQTVSEKTYRLDEVDDPDVLAALKRNGYYRKNIMDMFS